VNLSSLLKGATDTRPKSSRALPRESHGTGDETYRERFTFLSPDWTLSMATYSDMASVAAVVLTRVKRCIGDGLPCCVDAVLDACVASCRLLPATEGLPALHALASNYLRRKMRHTEVGDEFLAREIRRPPVTISLVSLSRIPWQTTLSQSLRVRGNHRRAP